MNKAQRKRLGEIESTLTDLKDELQLFADEEQEKYDNLSEGLQASERGQEFENNAQLLEGITSNLDEAISTLGELI